MNKAIFLDRDGVLTKMIFNNKTGENEPPHRVEDLEIYDYAYDSLRRLEESGYLLFLVSNQPDFAKGKTSLESIYAVRDEFEKRLAEKGVKFKDFFYCYHHPNGINKDFSFQCECRKPKTFFVDKAVKEYNIDRKKSWFIGDRESDIQCGKNAALKTVLINERKINEFGSDFSAVNLEESVKIILLN